VRERGDYDIAVLGGTGFLGTHVIKRLLAANQRVGVMARNVRNLSAEFYDDRVVMLRGDIRRPTDVERAIGKATVVINLAHGGGGKTYDEVRASMVGGAEAVARVCLSRGVRRLVHIGSIASLYLGPQSGHVIDSTPPDPRQNFVQITPVQRPNATGAFGNANRRTPACILRPGLVGEAALRLMAALGLTMSNTAMVERKGYVPLPFVLVEDVAEAIWQACSSQGVWSYL
jgi:nucleoside-diphosphate-sugar epimerase